MTDQSNIFSFYQGLFKDFLYNFTYYPITHWERFISPTFNFIGKNVEDAPTERYILSEVGSYGMQINRIINVLTVLVKKASENKDISFTEDEKIAIDLFNKLAKDAAEASMKFREERLDRMIKDLHSLKAENQNRYHQLIDRLQAEFPK